MNKSIISLVLFVAPLVILLSACSNIPERIITNTEVVEVPEIDINVIIQPRPNPVIILDAEIIVITEDNIVEVTNRVLQEQGAFVVYGLSGQSFENLAQNLSNIKEYIEKLNAILLYYEKAVSPE